jgi:hypothetical protein
MRILDSAREVRRSAASSPKTDFEHRLADHIERRVNGRISHLDVVCSEERIIVRGCSRSYHAKQLAQQAILEMTDGYPLLTNQIVVY